MVCSSDKRSRSQVSIEHEMRPSRDSSRLHLSYARAKLGGDLFQEPRGEFFGRYGSENSFYDFFAQVVARDVRFQAVEIRKVDVDDAAESSDSSFASLTQSI